MQQLCDNGETDWANVPAAGIDTRGLKSPAALLQVLPAAATTTATPAAAPAAHVHAH